MHQIDWLFSTHFRQPSRRGATVYEGTVPVSVCLPEQVVILHVQHQTWLDKPRDKREESTHTSWTKPDTAAMVTSEHTQLTFEPWRKVKGHLQIRSKVSCNQLVSYLRQLVLTMEDIQRNWNLYYWWWKLAIQPVDSHTRGFFLWLLSWLLHTVTNGLFAWCWSVIAMCSNSQEANRQGHLDKGMPYLPMWYGLGENKLTHS